MNSNEEYEIPVPILQGTNMPFPFPDDTKTDNVINLAVKVIKDSSRPKITAHSFSNTNTVLGVFGGDRNWSISVSPYADVTSYPSMSILPEVDPPYMPTDEPEYFPANRGPFTGVASREIGSWKAQLNQRLLVLRTTVDQGIAERLVNRIGELYTNVRADLPDYSEPSISSLDALIQFITNVEHPAYPQILLTPTGNLRAKWKKPNRQHFAVEFLPSNYVRWVVFCSDPDDPGKQFRIAGTVSIKNLMSSVNPFGVNQWIARD